MTRPTSESVPKAMEPLFQAVTELTDEFCKAHLTDEYAVLCRQMAAALCRKRTSPLASGRLEGWAAGIVTAIAGLNFLFDRSNPHYLTVTDIAGAFGIAKSTAGSKATAIRNALNITTFDWHWSVPSRVDDYPGAWLVQLSNGLIADARTLPREIQEEAFAKGYIPYWPGERKRTDAGQETPAG